MSVAIKTPQKSYLEEEVFDTGPIRGERKREGEKDASLQKEKTSWHSRCSLALWHSEISTGPSQPFIGWSRGVT